MTVGVFTLVALLTRVKARFFFNPSPELKEPPETALQDSARSERGVSMSGDPVLGRATAVETEGDVIDNADLPIYNIVQVAAQCGISELLQKCRARVSPW